MRDRPGGEAPPSPRPRAPRLRRVKSHQGTRRPVARALALEDGREPRSHAPSASPPSERSARLPSSRRRLRRSRGGALEGMGLELIVSFMVIAAGVGLLFAWLAYDEVQHLSGLTVREANGATGSFVTASTMPVKVWVEALDEHGTGLPGVSITLTGGGTGAEGATGGNGSVLLTFTPVGPAHSPYVQMSVAGAYSPPVSVGSSATETASTSFLVYLA